MEYPPIPSAVVSVRSIAPSRKPQAVADLCLVIETDLGRIEIADCRVLKNRNGIAWFSLPTFAVCDSTGKVLRHEPIVTLTRELKEAVPSIALRAFETWEREQSGSSEAGGVL